MTHKHPHAEHKTIGIQGIEIDKGIARLIVMVWGRGVKTYESCQGKGRERAYLIIKRKDLKKVRDLLPKKIRVEEGSGGYDLRDYHPRPPAQENLIYISWKGGKRK